MPPKIPKKMLLAAWSINNPHWIINQAYQVPLRKIFKKVINFDPQEETYTHGKRIMNERFLSLLRKEKPDYIHLFLVWDEFYPETLVAIKEILPNVKVTNWNGDDDIKFENYTVPYSAAIDYQLISQLQFTKKYDAYGLPWYDLLGADTNKFRPLHLSKKYDVVFVGTPKGDRLKYMRFLLKNKVNFTLAGAGWDAYPEFKEHYIGKVPDEEFIRLINQTKISLCFSQNFFSSPHVLERSLAINACNTFALTEYVEGYFPKFSEGKDIVTFKNEKELLEKITYYLQNEKERERIAHAGFLKVTKYFSNDKVMSDAFHAIEQDTRELNGAKNQKYLLQKPLYLDQEELNKGISYLKEKTKNYRYITFKHKGHEPLPYRDYFQMYSMDLVDKPYSICDASLSSRLIGDYATLSLYYAYNYYSDKHYAYANADVSQFMVRRDYFLKHFTQFSSLFNGKLPTFITPENAHFISMPLMRSNIIKPLPLKEIDHILFLHIERELLVLRNQKRLWRSSYPYRLFFYSLFINPQIIKQLLVNVIPKAKHAHLTKIAHFLIRFL